jgi:arsenite methyltransferase
MKQKISLKDLVKEKYGLIANQSKAKNETSCCGSGGCGEPSTYTIFSDSYSHLPGYSPEADLGLGCGLPIDFAGIQTGDHVLDLGSGAGNDCFVARSLTGETGQVTGLDFTEEMIVKARENNNRLGYQNVDFILGDIENIPVPDQQFDVIISNCVLNLVPDKARAFSEIFRVMKPGGHFCISDVVIKGELPQGLKESAEMYAGCVAGALPVEEVVEFTRSAGFHGTEIKKSKKIIIPDSILSQYLSSEEIAGLNQDDKGIFSITFVAKKR